MKWLLSSFVGFLVAASFVTAGCASVASPVPGCIMLDVKAAHQAHSEMVSTTKVGKATAGHILGWIGSGDASITAACENGEITKISHVDYHSTNLLGIIGDYTTIVYGE